MSELLVYKEYENLVPPLSPEDYNSLKESIKNNEQWLPILVNSDGVILDGHHRYRICQELGKEPKTSVVKFSSTLEETIFVGECNLKRRQLTSLQRIALVVKLEPFYAEKALSRMKSGTKLNPKEIVTEGGQVRDILGKKAHVSGNTYHKGTTVLEKSYKKGY